MARAVEISLRANEVKITPEHLKGYVLDVEDEIWPSSHLQGAIDPGSVLSRRGAEQTDRPNDTVNLLRPLLISTARKGRADIILGMEGTHYACAKGPLSGNVADAARNSSRSPRMLGNDPPEKLALSQ